MLLTVFMDYKTLRTITRTLIFKQFKKNTIFTIFIVLLLDCKARLKKILVYKAELTFKISENRIFFQIIFTIPPIVNGFFILVEGQNSAHLSVSMFFCICYYRTFNL